MIKTIILDGKGSGLEAEITSSRALRVQQEDAPNYNKDSKQKIIYRQYFRNASGSSDMRVDGSVDNQDFYISADDTYDIYITSISFLISDANASLSQFGAITALTNGCRLLYQNRELGNSTINDSLKSNFDFIRMCLGYPAFGDAATAFKASNVISTSEAYMPILNFSFYGLQNGIRLEARSTQRIIMTIRDNVSAIDQFDMIANGFKVV